MIKLTEDDISNSNTKIFGDWVKKCDILSKEFETAKPFPHIMVDNFLRDDIAEKISSEFPPLSDKWWSYHNPIEVKYAYDFIRNLPLTLRNVFYALANPEIVNKMRTITGLNTLTYDPYLHGAGIHAHPRNGRLMMHLDYEKHPYTDSQRRLNIILYLSKDWNPEWNGATELWNKDASKKIVQSDVVFNRAIIFQTNEESWHGVPEKIMCPKGVLRKSLAFYYVSPLDVEASKDKIGAGSDGYRTKACFVMRPTDKACIQLEKLLKIRPHRRITEKDMEEIYPEWDETD